MNLSLIIHFYYTQASIKCTSKIDGEVLNCRDIVINGTEATLDGVENYPNVTFDYSMDICNYNLHDMTLSRGKKDVEASSYMKFWYPDPWPNKTYIEEEEFCDSNDCGGAITLKSKECFSVPKNSVTVKTTRANYFLETQVQGPLATQAPESFCYAYAYEPISLDFDYGDGPCEMGVSTHENLHFAYNLQTMY